jgi:hypothetical protein
MAAQYKYVQAVEGKDLFVVNSRKDVLTLDVQICSAAAGQELWESVDKQAVLKEVHSVLYQHGA